MEAPAQLLDRETQKLALAAPDRQLGLGEPTYTDSPAGASLEERGELLGVGLGHARDQPAVRLREEHRVVVEIGRATGVRRDRARRRARRPWPTLASAAASPPLAGVAAERTSPFFDRFVKATVEQGKALGVDRRRVAPT